MIDVVASPLLMVVLARPLMAFVMPAFAFLVLSAALSDEYRDNAKSDGLRLGDNHCFLYGICTVDGCNVRCYFDGGNFRAL